jgi:hypothetical protein
VAPPQKNRQSWGLTAGPIMCKKYYMSGTRRKKHWDSATDALREAIVESGMSFLELQRRSGVKRQSLMKFVRGEQSLRLDMADRLMACLGLRVVVGQPRRKKGR